MKQTLVAMLTPPPLPKRRRRIARMLEIGLGIAALLALGWRLDLMLDVESRIKAIKDAGLPTTGAELIEPISQLSQPEPAGSRGGPRLTALDPAYSNYGLLRTRLQVLFNNNGKEYRFCFDSSTSELIDYQF